MRRLRIKGLVSLADSVRRELASQVPDYRRNELSHLVLRSLREVDRIVARRGTTIRALSTRSRRAYAFLAGLDFARLPIRPTPQTGPTPRTDPAPRADLTPGTDPTTPTDQAPRTPPQSVPAQRRNMTFPGIKAYLDQVCAQLSEPISADEADDLHESIRATSRKIEGHLRAGELSGWNLTRQSRLIRGWLAFFAERENLDSYVAAVDRARAAFERAIDLAPEFSRPAIVAFKQSRSLYRIRGEPDETRVALATPMICFSDALFAAVARAAIHGGPKQAMVEAASGEAYQGIQAELEALSGGFDETAGVHRDLEASFHRVATAYFNGDMARPRLAWSHSFTGRKFGHYDCVGDFVMISCTLDCADVPEFVLDSVMHHELLHKKHGLRWHDGRMNAHTPEFRREERRFTKYHEADRILKRLAGEF